MAIGNTILQSDLHNNDDHDARVHDYLDDKLQNELDLENIDVLLRNALEQQDLLREQLVEAEAILRETSQTEETHKRNLQEQARDFARLQDSIDRRVLVLTQSETSDDAIKKFEASIASLRRLDVARAYISLLEQVEKLSSEVTRSSGKSPKEALKPYVKLKELARAIKAAQPAADDAAPHLVDHVEVTTAAVWKQLKSVFSADLESILKTIKWPSKNIALGGEVKAAWDTGIVRLLELQDPELQANENKSQADGNMARRPLVLLPLEVMVRDFELRFKYHFEGDKPTNRTDKPEYFLSHVTNLLSSYDDFFAQYLQPVLSDHFRGSNLALNTAYIDSTSALITALLPMLRHKILQLLPVISRQPQLLSHFMHELIGFDATITEEWGYNGGNVVDGWKGLTWEVLVEQDWFPRWLQVEKDFALARYHSIVEPAESREIDFDSVDAAATKPMKSAVRVNDLLETITDRYRPLQSFSQQLHFLIDIQIAIFDEFHGALSASLDAYIALRSSIARTVQGVSKEEQAKVEGLSGLERLCRVYGSSEYLEKKMRDWSDNVFFLELWDELQYRARKGTKSNENTTEKPYKSDIVERTANGIDFEQDSGALFDETAGSYRRLRVKTEEVMQENLIYDIRESLRPYPRISSWSSISAEPIAATAPTISSELVGCTRLLESYLSFLSRTLAETSLRRIARSIALAIQSYLWDNVLSRHNFSTTGIAQLQCDVKEIWTVFDSHAGKGQGRLGMRRLADALILIGMPVAPEGDVVGTQHQSENQPDIRDIEKRVFDSNESARNVLEELGLDALTESDARTILNRRVELLQ